MATSWKKVPFLRSSVWRMTIGMRHMLRNEHGFTGGPLDFVFIDHDKAAYLPDLRLILDQRWLRPVAIVVADNVKFPGAPKCRSSRRDTCTMSDLATKNCVPCRGGHPPLDAKQRAELLRQLDAWTVERGHHLTKTYTFPDFAQGLAFVNRLGVLADQQGHHPDIHLAWGTVRVEIWTHKIDGLTESDFVFAAKADQCMKNAE